MSIDISALKQRAKMQLHGINKEVTLNHQGTSDMMCYPNHNLPKDNPFKSKAQQRYMFAKHPKIAKEFAKKTKSIKLLPEKVKKGGK